MGYSPAWLKILEAKLKDSNQTVAIDSVTQLYSNAFKIQLDSVNCLAKFGPAIVDESLGLREISQVANGPITPRILISDNEILLTEWIDQVSRSPGHEEELGRCLANLHNRQGDYWGGGSHWIGNCEVDPVRDLDGAKFYGYRLVELAQRCGMQGEILPIVERLDSLVPFGSPRLLHGDLWWGNILWGQANNVWVIDPSQHYGHPEEDLAMLALFAPISERTIAAYQEIRSLEDGWPERVELWQLYPLLVHTILFGEAYRSKAVRIAEQLNNFKTRKD